MQFPLGTHVLVIDQNGMTALGHLEVFWEDRQVYDVAYISRKAEVQVTTDMSASSRFENFGGNREQAKVTLSLEGAVHVSDPRVGMPRFVLANEDAQPLRDLAMQAGLGGLTSTGGPDVSTGQESAGASPQPTGITTAPLNPQIPVGVVEEPTDVPVETAEEHKRKKREGLL